MITHDICDIRECVLGFTGQKLPVCTSKVKLWINRSPKAQRLGRFRVLGAGVLLTGLLAAADSLSHDRFHHAIPPVCQAAAPSPPLPPYSPACFLSIFQAIKEELKAEHATHDGTKPRFPTQTRTFLMEPTTSERATLADANTMARGGQSRLRVELKNKLHK